MRGREDIEQPKDSANDLDLNMIHQAASVMTSITRTSVMNRHHIVSHEFPVPYKVIPLFQIISAFQLFV